MIIVITGIVSMIGIVVMCCQILHRIDSNIQETNRDFMIVARNLNIQDAFPVPLNRYVSHPYPSKFITTIVDEDS